MAFIDTVTEMEQVQDRIRQQMAGVHVVNVDVEKLRKELNHFEYLQHRALQESNTEQSL